MTNYTFFFTFTLTQIDFLYVVKEIPSYKKYSEGFNGAGDWQILLVSLPVSPDYELRGVNS